jgi:hypothetical protein
MAALGAQMPARKRGTIAQALRAAVIHIWRDLRGLGSGSGTQGIYTSKALAMAYSQEPVLRGKNPMRDSLAGIRFHA